MVEEEEGAEVDIVEVVLKVDRETEEAIKVDKEEQVDRICLLMKMSSPHYEVLLVKST